MKTKLLVILSLCFITSGSLTAQTWTQQTTPGGTINGLSGAWACDANVVWMCGPSGVVIRTTNGGANWTMVNAGLTGNDFYTIAAIDANIAEAGAGDGGMWRTTNGGTSWTSQTLTPTPIFMDVIHFFDSQNGFALSDPGAAAGLWNYYITTNGGISWTAGANRPPNAAGEAGYDGSYAALDTGHIWWGTNASKIWKGSFRGPFTSASTIAQNSFSLAFNDVNTGLAGMVGANNTPSAISISTNGGISWSNTSYVPSGFPFAMKYAPGTGYAWYASTNIYRTTNNGGSWTQQQALGASNFSSCFTMLNLNTGWAGTGTGQVYKYHDVVGITPYSNEVPKSFALYQNYPNPFNPTTNIHFSVPKDGTVSLKVYDMLGNLVDTYVDGFVKSGTYNAEVDASNWASGIYFYTLRTNSFVETKKMSLIK